MDNKKQVAVVIPVYKAELSELEDISLKQAVRTLGRYDIYFMMPDTLEFNMYEDTICREKFDSSFFTSIAAYNELMMKVDFYERFRKYEYILIYQLDAFVFSDQLEYFCSLGYDYIGAPWISGAFWYVDSRHCIWNVGNGGLSLRKVDSIINLLKSEKKCRNNLKINEDVYFAISNGENFSVAPQNIALKFSLESEVRECYRLNNNFLPFGCHAWAKYDLKFWKPYIESNGYYISAECLLHGHIDENNSKDDLLKKRFSEFWKNEYSTEMLRKSIVDVFGNMKKHFAIFGAGYWGNNLCTMLIDAGFQVDFFVDNNLNVRHKLIQGVEVIGLDEVKTGEFNIITAIAGESEKTSVREQLHQKGYEYKKDYIMIQDIGFIKDNSIF
jgi:hypothetical protein